MTRGLKVNSAASRLRLDVAADAVLARTIGLSAIRTCILREFIEHAVRLNFLPIN